MRTFAEDLNREYALRRLFAVAAGLKTPQPILRGHPSTFQETGGTR